MWRTSDTKNTKMAILLSSVLRWLFGIVFLTIAYVNYGKDGWWILLLFGTAFLVTGFLRPKRCIDDHSCTK